MNLLDRELPEPDFIARDAAAITQEIITHYETLTGKTLYPAQVERLLIDVIAYREKLVREAFQDGAKLNLVRFSRGVMLDYIGENVGVERLEGESDDHLKERIVLAPESFSVAGPGEAYRFHALSADPTIIDCAVLRHTPTPGDVTLMPLLATGLPGGEIKQKVLDRCSDKKVRPLNDSVFVADPVPVDYAIHVALVLKIASDQETALAEANKAASAFRDARMRLGTAIVRSQLIDALHGYGVYSVDVISPASDLVLNEWEFPRCTGINLTVAGTANG